MKDYTNQRSEHSDDDYLIMTEHEPVYTMGPSANEKDIFSKENNIPFVPTNRGGKITYHGPGQLVIYTLLNLRRLNLQPHQLIDLLEDSTMALLNTYDIQASLVKEHRGVYIDKKKIASVGIRVSKGCSYHGLSINLNTNLNHFNAIRPCGINNIKMVNLSQLCHFSQMQLQEQFLTIFCDKLSIITGMLIDIQTESDKIFNI